MKACHASGLSKSGNRLRTSTITVDSAGRSKTDDFWEQGAKNTIYGGLMFLFLAKRKNVGAK